MTRARAAPSAARVSLVVGAAAAFVGAVEITRWIRVGLLLDREPGWAPARLMLVLFAVSVAAAAGVLGAALCRIVASSRVGALGLEPMPFSAAGLAALAGAAVLAGAALRLVALSEIPGYVWIDDVSLMAPALGLRDGTSGRTPLVFAVPFGPEPGRGSVTVLYMELYHFCLERFGASMTGLRAPSALGGLASLVTGTLLGVAFLPRGGAALTALALAGLRWHLIMSRWAWNAIVVAPLLDLAALAMLRARRRSSPAMAMLSGALCAAGAYVYLSAWVAAAALGLWALWPAPAEANETLGRRGLRAVLFAGAFALVFAPVVLDGGDTPYFARVGANTPWLDVRRTGSVFPVAEAAADALGGPFWVGDPLTRHDLPGRARMGWILAIPMGAALWRALLRPREDLSAFLLSTAAAAFLSTLAWGRPGTPNGYRYAYLATPAALAAAAGGLWLLAAVPAMHRRPAALAILGAFVVSSALGARDALLVWPNHPATFAGFDGGDTLVARAAARWDRYGRLDVDPALTRWRIFGDVRRYALDPQPPVVPASVGPDARRRFRIVPGGAAPHPDERVVERVRDPWGRVWALVVGRREGPS